MKYYFLLLSLVLTTSSSAQLGWFQLHLNISGSYKDISFLTSENGFLITDNPSKIYSTLNGGSFWQEITLPSCTNCTYHFRNIFFVNSIIGYIIGYSQDGNMSQNLLFKTTNSGISWFRDSALYPYPLPFPSISDSLAFRADSIYFEKTIDGAKSWTVVNTITFDSLGKFIAFDYRDANNLILISEAGDPPNTIVEVSNDGGFTWLYSALEWVIDYTEAYQTVKALPDNVYLVGGEGIFRSTENGKSRTWSKVSNYYSSNFTFYNSKIGYTGGYWGYIQHTIDSGKTWGYQNVRDTGIYWDSATYWQRISAPLN